MLDQILSKRKFTYIGYEIMKMNAINNATKLKVIFFLEDQIFNNIFILVSCNESFKKKYFKKLKKNIFCKGFLQKNKFSIKFQINFVRALGLPRQ